MANERIVVNGKLDHWRDGCDEEGIARHDGDYFMLSMRLTGEYSGARAEEFFGKVVSAGKRVRLIIELPEGDERRSERDPYDNEPENPHAM